MSIDSTVRSIIHVADYGTADDLEQFSAADLRKAAREYFSEHPDGTTWTAFAKKAETITALITGKPPKSEPEQGAALFDEPAEKTAPVRETITRVSSKPAPTGAPSMDAAALGQMILQAAGGGQVEQQIQQMQQEVGEAIEEMSSRAAKLTLGLQATVNELVEELPASIDERVRKIVEKRLPREITLKLPNVEPVTVKNAHSSFETYSRAAMLGTVALTGPAGSGKTTAAVKFAEATGRECTVVSVGAQTSKSDIFGYMNAAGDYVESAVYRAISSGHVLLLDEFDACNPGVSKQMNAILDADSDTVEFPAGKVRKADGFQCTLAMNTTGRGADRIYLSGRPQDGSSLDRLFWIHWGYDTEMENRAAMAQGADEEATRRWIETIDKLREAIDTHGLRVVVGTRAKILGARLLAAGFTHDEALRIKIFDGLSTDETDILRAAC